MQKSMSLKHDPASEPLHISAKELLLNWEPVLSQVVSVGVAALGTSNVPIGIGAI